MSKLPTKAELEKLNKAELVTETLKALKEAEAAKKEAEKSSDSDRVKKLTEDKKSLTIQRDSLKDQLADEKVIADEKLKAANDQIKALEKELKDVKAGRDLEQIKAEAKAEALEQLKEAQAALDGEAAKEKEEAATGKPVLPPFNPEPTVKHEGAIYTLLNNKSHRTGCFDESSAGMMEQAYNLQKIKSVIYRLPKEYIFEGSNYETHHYLVYFAAQHKNGAPQLFKPVETSEEVKEEPKANEGLKASPIK